MNVCFPAFSALSLLSPFSPLLEWRSILTFVSQMRDSSSSSSHNSSKIPSIFGADSEQEARLDSSILGSIIPALDPEPPGRVSLQNRPSSVAEVSSPPARAGATRPAPSPAPDDTADGPTDAPVSDRQEWTRDGGGGGGGGGSGGSGVAAATVVGAERLAVGTATVRGPVAGRREAEVARRKRRRVKHGLRVLLRGTSRCAMWGVDRAHLQFDIPEYYTRTALPCAGTMPARLCFRNVGVLRRLRAFLLLCHSTAGHTLYRTMLLFFSLASPPGGMHQPPEGEPFTLYHFLGL